MMFDSFPKAKRTEEDDENRQKDAPNIVVKEKVHLD